MEKPDPLAAATSVMTLVPVLGQVLPLAIQLIGIYRSTRNAIEASNPGGSGMLSDAELIDLLDQDSTALVEKSNEMIAKYAKKG